GLLSEATFGDPARQRTDMYDAAILITNLAPDDPGEMIGVLEAVRAKPVGGLLIAARSLSPAVAGLLHANSVPGRFPIVVVKTPVHGQRGAIDDLAVLTGGRPFLKEAGDSLRRFFSNDFGQARTAWVTRQQFGLIGGQGDPQAVRRHTETLRGSHRSAGDKDARRDSLQRLGTLQGTSATLWIGANSDLEAKNRLAAAGRAAQTLRLALRDGVVPGGGVALLHGQDAMSERLKSSGDEMEEAALRIVIDALRAPAEALLINCGYEPAPVIAGIRRRGAPTGYDVIAGCFGDMHAMGLVDPARVVATAARTAVRGAALALTIDVIVHTRTTEVSTSPE
nr:hypothetical protein [Chloroflexia bacterium]